MTGLLVTFATLNVSVRFSVAFAGFKNLFVNVHDNSENSRRI